MNLFNRKKINDFLKHRSLTTTEEKLLFSFGKVYLNECEQEFAKTKPLYNIGQCVYLNVYEKLFDPLGFGWDTSISSFLSLVGYPRNLKLPYVEVTGNKIHTMLYENALEIFINNHANEQHLTYESFINSFKLYLLNWGTVNKNLKKNNLLYYEVTFKPLNFEFSPTWGLHECSFLNETDAISTKILYEKEQKLKEQFKKIKSDLEIHQSKIREYAN